MITISYDNGAIETIYRSGKSIISFKGCKQCGGSGIVWSESIPSKYKDSATAQCQRCYVKFYPYVIWSELACKIENGLIRLQAEYLKKGYFITNNKLELHPRMKVVKQLRALILSHKPPVEVYRQE